MSGVRSTLAIWGLQGTNALSRLTGRGKGTVAGGRVGLALEPRLLASTSHGRRVALVSGTNGKTTTTALLAAALGADGARVATNATGSNMPAGHVAALVGDRGAKRVVLEVDEGYLEAVLHDTEAEVVVLLNLSRDQLDRMSEVRMLAERWHRALVSDTTRVLANADDPLVAFAARDAAAVTWVAAGLAWKDDATGCPVCGSRIAFVEEHWACTSCAFARPQPTWRLEGSVAVGPFGSVPLDLALPGRFNLDNALLALAASVEMGIELTVAARALGEVRDVAGRFVTTTFAGATVRMMLAKNPAGWSALLDLVADASAPVVVAINARVADGFDPSWLWDVPFARLAGRTVVATGDRWRDLSLRLHYAGVDHRATEDRREAVRLAAHDSSGGVVDVIGNYTAFGEMLVDR